VPTILITAFEPYGRWTTNASALALAELQGDLSLRPNLTTRLLPVNYDRVNTMLADELATNYDYVIHLGQAPGAAKIQFEAVGLNVAYPPGAGRACPLCEDGPIAYRSLLPLEDWASLVSLAGIPAEVSFHAGTYLCNAALYLTHYFIERMQLKSQATFIHLPLDPSQTADDLEPSRSMPASQSAAAIRIVLESIS
jgi:pyroglutamyl-peptidase